MTLHDAARICHEPVSLTSLAGSLRPTCPGVFPWTCGAELLDEAGLCKRCQLRLEDAEADAALEPTGGPRDECE